MEAIEVGWDSIFALELGPNAKKPETDGPPLEREVHRLPRPPRPPGEPPVRQYRCHGSRDHQGPRQPTTFHHPQMRSPPRGNRTPIKEETTGQIKKKKKKYMYTFTAEKDEADDHEKGVEDLKT